MSFENQKCIDEWGLKPRSASTDEWSLKTKSAFDESGVRPEKSKCCLMASQPKFIKDFPAQMLLDGFPAKKFKGLPSPNVAWWLPSQSLKDFPAQMLFDGFPAKV